MFCPIKTHMWDSSRHPEKHGISEKKFALIQWTVQYCVRYLIHGNVDTFINISLPHFNTDKPNAEYPYFLSPLFFHMYVLRQCSLLSLRIYDNCDFDLLWSQKALSIWSCIFHWKLPPNNHPSPHHPLWLAPTKHVQRAQDKQMWTLSPATVLMMSS